MEGRMITDKMSAGVITRKWRHFENRARFEGVRIHNGWLKASAKDEFPKVYSTLTTRETGNDILYLLRAKDADGMQMGDYPLLWYLLINGERGIYAVEQYRVMTKFGLPIPYYMLYPPMIFERFAKFNNLNLQGADLVREFFSINGTGDMTTFKYEGKPYRACVFDGGLGFSTYMSDSVWMLKTFIPDGDTPTEEEQKLIDRFKLC